MLIRILGEGQYVVPDAELDEINRLDSALEAALKSRRTTSARRSTRCSTRSARSAYARRTDSLEESGVILPFADSDEDDIRACSTTTASSRADPLDRAPPRIRSGGGASSSAGGAPARQRFSRRAEHRGPRRSLHLVRAVGPGEDGVHDGHDAVRERPRTDPADDRDDVRARPALRRARGGAHRARLLARSSC